MSKNNHKPDTKKSEARQKAVKAPAKKKNSGAKEASNEKTPAKKTSAPKTKKTVSGFEGKIALVGFMGAGKTTIAERLAQETGASWLDLDEYISALESREISQIINNLGEKIFREIETAALEEVAVLPSPKIYSLGGGTFLSASNREILSRAGIKTVWLDVPFETCWQRIIGEGEERPLAKTKKSAKKLFDERRESYTLADIHAPLEDIGDESNVKVLVDLVSRHTAKKTASKTLAKDKPSRSKNARQK